MPISLNGDGIVSGINTFTTPFTFVGVTTFGSVSIGNANITNGATISGVTTVSSANVTGILTAATSVVVGSAVTINSSGVIAVGIVTASAFVDDGTNLLTEINKKTSTGKAIAMSMIFG
jgi:hypothetical protein